MSCWGERPDLLAALRGIAEIEIVAVARDRAPVSVPPGMAPELFRCWPERGPGARERREGAIAGWFLARDVGLVVAAGWLWILTPTFLSALDRVVNVHFRHPGRFGCQRPRA